MRDFFLMSDAWPKQCTCDGHAHDTDEQMFGECYQCGCSVAPSPSTSRREATK